MPTLPLHISGTFTNADTNYTIRAWNSTTNSGCVGDMGSDGKFLIDLANCGYSVGDVIYINIHYKIKARTENFTITQAMIDDGEYDMGTMDLYFLPEHIFSVVYDLINDNKPSSFTDNDGTTSVSWSLFGAFPEKTPAFPCIILNPSNINYRAISIDGTQANNPINIDIEYYSKAKWKKKRIDNGRGNTAYIIDDNRDILEFSGLYLPEEYIDDSNVDSFDLEKERLNTATQTLRLRWSL